MTSFQPSELTELPVVEYSQLFAQRAHSARYAPWVPIQGSWRFTDSQGPNGSRRKSSGGWWCTPTVHKVRGGGGGG